MKLAILFIGFTLCYYASCDNFMHVLRGSNNRLDENTANRANGNRIFDSQNNDKGGYNVGDRTNKKAKDTGNTATIIDKNQYNMEFYESVPDGPSRLQLEWTNQHGCGGNEDDNPHKLNCNFVLQYMCQPDVGTVSPDTIRNGVNTNTNDYEAPKNGETQADFAKRKAAKNKYGAGNSKDSRGMHERFEWYDKCKQRERNKGLFTADQDLRNKNKAINTRQNRNGNRRGYECPEERDYYPYWHPTSWRDVAVFANNASFCDMYKRESFNVAPRHECVEKWKNGQVKHYSEYNNEKDCVNGKGEWLEFHNYLETTAIKSESACKDAGYIWARPIYNYNKECLVPLTEPHCEAAPWTRVNHLGNSAKGGDLQTPNYMWEIPHFPSDKTQRCVFRIRYNISTDDYDPWNTDWTLNGDKGYSFISNDPKVDIGASNEELQLNINTAQTGRTFQDRSHVFKILNRPAAALKKTIHNIGVRGKRGNIVQTFPAVEYDFTPTDIIVKQVDLVHYQWTGSNSHNNGGRGSDGQTGDDGEGTGGTDRNNCVPMTEDRGMNFPVLSESALNMFNTATVVHEHESLKKLHPASYSLNAVDVYVQHASSGHYVCGVCKSEHSLKEKKEKMKGKLNEAPPSYPGLLMHFKKGKYNYMCTRNNNFSNRSQKGTITVV